MTERKNLIIVRAGDLSLHEGWLQGAGTRNWDLIVSYFGDDPNRYVRDDVRRIDSKGPKWPALHALIKELGAEILRYERIWLPDDDLRATKDGINLFFDICARYSLVLAQPSLAPDSHIGHLITLRNRSFELRFTNFVEIMAPCFSSDFLQQALPSFNANLSGWGLDFIWPTQVGDWMRIAIVDLVSVCHTRPIGGPNYQHLANSGKTPEQELWEEMARYGLTRIEKHFVRGGVDKAGQRLSIYDATSRALIDSIVIGYLPELANHSQALMDLVRPNLDQLAVRVEEIAPLEKSFDAFAVRKDDRFPKTKLNFEARCKSETIIRGSASKPDSGRNNNVLISFPRSGTDFLCSAVAQDRNIKYFREYFNPICNPKREDTLAKCFGDERVTHYLGIMREVEADAFYRTIRETWNQDEYNTTKENFSAIKLKFFVPEFNVVMLFRKMCHTFPTSRPDFIVPILHSFMQAGSYRTVPLSVELNELRKFVSDFSIYNYHEAGMLSYLIQHYILAEAARSHNIPIIWYEDLVTKDGVELEHAVEPLVCFGVDAKSVAIELRRKRMTYPCALEGRRNKFAKIKPGDWFNRVAEFIFDASPLVKPTLEKCIS